MKKVLSVILAAAIIFSCFVFSTSAQDAETVYVGNGLNSVIVTAEDATAQESYAAKTLQKYISEITGKTVEIAHSYPEIFDRAIYVGAPEKFDISSDGKTDGSYIIKAENDILCIKGFGNRGPIYGVYGFLEKYCGCRWYTKDLKVVPKSDKISVPENEKYEYAPFFECTDTDWLSPRDAEYSMAHGLNCNIYRYLSPEQGGNVSYISNFCHTLTSQFCSAANYFDEHPEYFALRDGKRIPDQLCLTNPDVIRIVTDEVMNLIAAKRDPSQAVQIVSLTQADNQNYCTCDKCKALDKANGSQSGTMITFANEVARAVKAAGYDNIAIDTFAYQYTRHTPTNVVPDDNVIVRICSIECCFGHALDDPDCKQNTEFMKDLVNWGKICNRIYVWDYANNYSYTVNIFPDFGVLQRNMQVFYENNAKGMYVEGNYYMDRCDAEFGELRSYMISRLIQNPYIDCDAVMNEFLEAYYGAGWENIREFIDITTKRAANKITHLGISQDPAKSLPGIKAKEIKKCDELWKNAEAMAQDETYLARVQRSELCWRFWKCANHKREFSRLRPAKIWMSAQENLYNDYKKFNVPIFGEYVQRGLTECEALYLLRKPTKWIERYEENYWDWLSPIVVKFYNLITDLFGVSKV